MHLHVAALLSMKQNFQCPLMVRTLVEVRTARRYLHDHSITSEVLL